MLPPYIRGSRKAAPPTATAGAPEGICYFYTGNAPKPSNSEEIAHPFGPGAVCNRPIGTGAQYATVTDLAYQSLTLVSHIDINNGNNYDHRVTAGFASDPLCFVAGPNVSLRIPAAFATGRTSGDRAVTIKDHTQNKTFQFFQFNHTSPTAATANGVYYPTLTGLDFSNPWPTGPRISSSAARIAQAGLLFRGAEINPSSASAPPIQHALHFIVDRSFQMSRDYVWPAAGVDGYINDPGNGQGAMRYGELWAIPPTTNLMQVSGIAPSNGGTVHRLRVARAFQDYGAYVPDTGAPMTARGDGNLDTTIKNDLTNNLTPRIIPLLRRITNNVPSDVYVVGGGTPLNQPNCGIGAAGVTWT